MRRKDDETITELAALEAFWRCTPAELRRVAAAATKVWLDPGEVLCHEGRRAQECFVIVDGEVDVTAGSEVLATLGRGQMVGELGLIDRLPRSASVVTRTAVVAYSIPAPAFPVMAETPGVASGMMRQLAARLRDADLRAGVDG